MTNIIKPEDIPDLIPSDDARKFFESQRDDSFLPNLKLLQGTSPELTEGHKAGNFFISVRNRQIGEKCVICVVGRRAHALLMRDGKKVSESFDKDSPVFKEIINTPSTPNQSVRSSYSIGDFLCYLPEEDEFVSYFPGIKSARPVSYEIIDHMTEVKHRKMESKKSLPHTNCFEMWNQMENFGPKNRCFVPHVKPLDPLQEYFPNQDDFDSAKKIFYSPVVNEVKVEEVTDDVER